MQLPSKISLTGQRLSHVACRNAPPPPIGVILHEEVYQLFIKTRQDVSFTLPYRIIMILKPRLGKFSVTLVCFVSYCCVFLYCSSSHIVLIQPYGCYTSLNRQQRSLKVTGNVVSCVDIYMISHFTLNSIFVPMTPRFRDISLRKML